MVLEKPLKLSNHVKVSSMAFLLPSTASPLCTAETCAGTGEASCPPIKPKGINPYLKSKINPHRSRKETGGPAHHLDQGADKLGSMQDYAPGAATPSMALLPCPWPTLALEAHQPSASGYTTEKPKTNQPHFSVSATDILHFHSFSFLLC